MTYIGLPIMAGVRHKDRNRCEIFLTATSVHISKKI